MTSKRINRRTFLKTVGAGAAAAAVASSAPNLPTFAMPSTDQRDPAWHVLNRLAFGPRPGDVEAVTKTGVDAFIKQQLDPYTINNHIAERLIDPYTTLNLDIGTLLQLELYDGLFAIKENDAATVMRAVNSRQQLFEVMCSFWSEHFSIWQFKDKDDIFKTIDDREVVRKNALGKFRDILGASAKSTAMLFYLDNTESTKEHPNENYARELMELHSITIGNYTEKDVKEVARCFTGWTWFGKVKEALGGFSFRATMHDDGEKTVLGKTIPAGGGIKDGEMVLDMLASHPATAHHISSKLCRRFIADDPPENVVKDCVDAFLTSGGDIPTVLRVIFAAPEFWSATPKYKRPFEFLISMARALNANIDPDKLTMISYLNRKYALVKAPQPNLLDALQSMGHLPFNHIQPDGYTDYASLWESALLERWNAAVRLLGGEMAGVTFDLDTIMRNANQPMAVTPVLQYYAKLLYGRDLLDTEQKALTAYVGGADTNVVLLGEGRTKLYEALAIMFSAPAFQWR